MAKLTEAKLRKWHRQAAALDERARRLMDEMTSVLGFDENTDCIDNVLASTEDLMSVLSRPELDMWKLKTVRPVNHRADDLQ